MISSKSEARLKQLRAALVRVANGRPRDAKNSVLSISAVAREAGVSASLLHNSYPQIVEEVRRRSAKVPASRVSSDDSSRMRAEVRKLKGDLAKLASINEALHIEVEVLREQLKRGKAAAVVSISGRSKRR